MKNTTHTAARSHSVNTHLAGFTLLEVMIALIIFSVGLLGLAGLQAYGIQSNQTAYLRGVAMQQVYNMSDRMRNNITGVQKGDYDNIPTTSGSSAPPTDCTAAACSVSDLAKFDAYEWNVMNASALPDGQGKVQKVSGTTNDFEITVMWNESRNSQPGTTCGSGNLKCYSLTVQP